MLPVGSVIVAAQNRRDGPRIPVPMPYSAPLAVYDKNASFDAREDPIGSDLKTAGNSNWLERHLP
jgi:hypothetical protein